MVIGIVGQVANIGIRIGARAFTRLHKTDVAIHKSLYGASGGRGVRHGRDAGIFLSQYREGDDLDDHAVPQPRYEPPSRQNNKTYRGYKRSSNARFGKYNRRGQCRCKPRRKRF